MARISTLTTGTPASTSALLGNVGTNTRSFDVEELLGVPITAAGDLLIGDSSNNTTRLAAGTSGQRLVATPVPKWIDDDWGISFVIDGGGSTITASTKGTIRIPWDVGLEGWELHGDTTGDITIDLYVEDFSSTPASSNSKITSTEVPVLTNAQRSSGTCSSWTTAITAGDYITVDVIAGSSDITLVTLSLWGKKLSTA